MLYIEKKPEPIGMKRDVAKIKSTPFWRKIKEGNSEGTRAIRAAFDSLDKDEIRYSLLEEQHGLCAYCMKKIHFVAQKRPGIDHYIPLHRNKEKALDYRNLLAVCEGGTDLGKRHPVKCCDKRKDEVKELDGEEKDLTISPLNKNLMERITYDTQGHIRFRSDGLGSEIKKSVEDDIDRKLQLNGEYKNGRLTGNDTATGLVKGRKDAYRRYVDFMERLGKRGGITKESLQKEIDRLETAGEREEFVGVIIHFLRRRLRAI